MRRARRLGRGAVALAALAVGVAVAPPTAADAGGELTIVYVNDFHGRIARSADAGGVDTVRYAGTIEQLRQAAPDSTLLVGGGDLVGASLFASALADDAPTIAVMNELGVVASTVGNHEFDQGFDDLVERLQPAAAWPYLGANVYAAGSFDPVLPEYQTVVVGARTVAIVGAVTAETASLVSPAGISGIEFGDPVDAVNRVAAQLSNGDPADGEADVIVAAYHAGAVAADGTLEGALAASDEFRSIVEDTTAAVDAILTAHTHESYAWQAPVPGDTARARPVLQSGAFAEEVGVLRFTFDAAGQVVSVDASNTPTTEEDADALIAAYPRVAAVAAIVDEAVAAAEVVGRETIAEIAAPITTAYRGGAYGSDGYAGGDRDDRSRESTLGVAVADALLASLADEERGGADVAVVNPGGLRADLTQAGDVTFEQANAVLPFANTLWTTTLTGAQFDELLEQQWQRDAEGEVPAESYLALGLSSNTTYTYDPTRAEGDRVTAITVDGEPVAPDDELRVGTWTFLVGGGDNFHVLAQGEDARDSGLIDRDAWIAYLESNPQLEPVTAKRGVAVVGVPTTAVRRGDTFEITVSDFDLTSLGSLPNTRLTASWDGSSAAAPVSVDVLDGAATIRVTVPADARATATLSFTAEPSGTTVQLPVEVADGLTGDEPVAPAWLPALLAVVGGLVVIALIAAAWLLVARRR